VPADEKPNASPYAVLPRCTSALSEATSAKSGARRIAALAMDSAVHGVAGGRLCRARLGAAGDSALSPRPPGIGSVGVGGASGRVCLRPAPGGRRVKGAAAESAGACGRGAFGGATRPAQRDDCALQPELQGAD